MVERVSMILIFGSLTGLFVVVFFGSVYLVDRHFAPIHYKLAKQFDDHARAYREEFKCPYPIDAAGCVALAEKCRKSARGMFGWTRDRRVDP